MVQPIFIIFNVSWSFYRCPSNHEYMICHNSLIFNAIPMVFGEILPIIKKYLYGWYLNNLHNHCWVMSLGFEGHVRDTVEMLKIDPATTQQQICRLLRNHSCKYNLMKGKISPKTIGIEQKMSEIYPIMCSWFEGHRGPLKWWKLVVSQQQLFG